MRKQVQEAQLDEPLAVADLKRFAADYVMKHEEPYTDLVFPKKGKSIGIIGAGRQGLPADTTWQGWDMMWMYMNLNRLRVACWHLAFPNTGFRSIS